MTVLSSDEIEPKGVLSADAVRSLEHLRREMRARKPASKNASVDAGKFKRFYRSRAWRAARYAFLKTQPRPLRCKCCGATAAHARLVVDHIVAIKKDWGRRLGQANLQLLCDDCNLAKASDDSTDWRTSDAPLPGEPTA
jgi:5-methylcytosine-specific restriction endonuclease McrA